MSILQDLLAWKQFEREQEVADIGQIANAATSFLNTRQQAIENARNVELDQLNQIESLMKMKQAEAGIELRKGELDLSEANLGARMQELGLQEQRLGLESDKLGLAERKVGLEEAGFAREGQMAPLEQERLKAQTELIRARTKSEDSPLNQLLDRSRTISTLQEAAKAGDQGALTALQEILNVSNQGVSAPVDVTASGVVGQMDVPSLKNISVDELLDSKELSLRRLSQEKDILGQSTPEAQQAKSELNLLQKTKESKVQVGKEVDAQRQKDILSSGQDLINAETKIDNIADVWLDMLDKTFEVTGVRPGIMGGAVTKVLGATKVNEFQEAFKGGLVEYAAAIGRIAMPGTRAARIISLFKKSAPTEFSTIESGVTNAAFSYRNAISTDFSRHTEEYIKGYNDMSFKEKKAARKNTRETVIKVEEERFKYGLLSRAWRKNPELLNSKTVDDLEERLLQDQEGNYALRLSNGDIMEVR